MGFTGPTGAVGFTGPTGSVGLTGPGNSNFVNFLAPSGTIVDSMVVPLIKIDLPVNATVNLSLDPVAFSSLTAAAGNQMLGASFFLVNTSDINTVVATAYATTFSATSNFTTPQIFLTYKNSTATPLTYYFCVRFTTVDRFNVVVQNHVATASTTITAGALPMLTLQLPLQYTSTAGLQSVTINQFTSNTGFTGSNPAGYTGVFSFDTNFRIDPGILTFSQGSYQFNSYIPDRTNMFDFFVAQDPNSAENYSAISANAPLRFIGPNGAQLRNSYYGTTTKDCVVTNYNSLGDARWTASVASTVTADLTNGGDEFARGLLPYTSLNQASSVFVYGSRTVAGTTSVLKAYSGIYTTGATGTAFALNVDSSTGSSQGLNGFVVKYSSAGAVQGLANINGIGEQNINNIAADRNLQRVYVAGNTVSGATGYFQCGASSYTTTPLFPVTNGVGVTNGGGYLIAESDTLVGAPVWYALVSSVNGTQSSCKAVATDASSNVLAVFTATGGSNLTLYNAGTSTASGFVVTNNNIIAGTTVTGLVQYSSSGVVKWRAAVNITTLVNNGEHRVCTDASGNVFLLIKAQTDAFNVTDSSNTSYVVQPEVFQYNVILKFNSVGIYVGNAFVENSTCNDFFVRDNYVYFSYFSSAPNNVSANNITGVIGDVNASAGNYLLRFNPANLDVTIIGYTSVVA
jgi:hypothetical protein